MEIEATINFAVYVADAEKLFYITQSTNRELAFALYPALA